MVKRIYIAGPIKGKPDLNREEFRKAAKFVEESSKGFSIGFNPHDVANMLGWDDGTSLSTIASVLLGDLASCDAIYMLRGWQDSKGATAEHAVAKWIGLEIIYQGEAE